MDIGLRAARAALVVAGAMTLLGTSTAIAAAQRSHPDGGALPTPRPPRIGVYNPRQDHPRTNDPRWNGSSPIDPRGRDIRGRQGQWSNGRQSRRVPNNVGSNVIVLPPGYGYGYSYGYGYLPSGYGMVYDVNGRPLSAGYLADQPVDRFSYTPDLSGSPYRVADNGMMLVDFDSGERRGFPSCASQDAARDPQGRSRTIFYQPPDYELVLGPGQRGRVLGNPPAGAAACYGLDTAGHVVLRY